jgi:HlyD family secretion protein
MMRLLAACGLVLAGTAACTPEAPPAGAAEADARRAVRTARVESRIVRDTLEVSGLLVARDEAAVGAELAGSLVAEVNAEVGDLVALGQPLAHLDATLLRAQVAPRNAQIAERRAARDDAASQLTRAESLGLAGALPAATLEERRHAKDRAEAALLAARAALSELETRLARTVVRAPVAGRVIERNVLPGELLGGSAPLFRIAGGDRVELDAEIPEQELARIAVGTPATVRLPSGVAIDGELRLVEPSVDPRTKLGRARIALPVHPELRPGGFARAVISGAAREAAMAPEAALRFSTEGTTVLVIAPDHRVRSAPIRTGARHDGWVELVEGPAPGSALVTGGSAFVLEGDRVEPSDAPAGAVEEVAR